MPASFHASVHRYTTACSTVSNIIKGVPSRLTSACCSVVLPAVRFLSCMRPALSEQQLMGIRSSIYSTTTAACFLIATMVPCTWSIVQLAARYLAAQQGQLQLTGVLALLTLLGLEVFMRFWFLAVMQLVWHRGVRPGLVWLLLRLAGSQYGGTASTYQSPGAGAMTGLQAR